MNNILYRHPKIIYRYNFRATKSHIIKHFFRDKMLFTDEANMTWRFKVPNNTLGHKLMFYPKNVTSHFDLK